MRTSPFVESLESRRLLSAAPVDISNPVVVEKAGGTFAVFTVRTASSLGAPISTFYSTFDGSAKSDAGDYTSTSNPISLKPGTSSTVSIRVKDDRSDEPDENFSLRINLGGAFAVMGRCTIRDNDAPPTVSVSNLAIDRPSDSAITSRFIVSLSSPSGFPVTVKYSTKDIQATAGVDYVAVVSSIVIKPGASTGSIPVVIKPRSTADKSQFFLNLSSSTNAVLGRRQAVGTIKGGSAGPGGSVVAPASLSGRSFHAVVTSGTYPFATKGSFTFTANAVSNSYVIHGDGTNVADSSGTYLYTRTNATTGVLVVNDSNLGFTLSESLTFTSEGAGHYHIESESVGGEQSGTFTLA